MKGALILAKAGLDVISTQLAQQGVTPVLRLSCLESTSRLLIGVALAVLWSSRWGPPF